MEAATPLTEKEANKGDNSLKSLGVSGELDTEVDVVIEANEVTCTLEQVKLQVVGHAHEEVRDIRDEGHALPKAPDGGYGWVVCAGCFIHHMIFGGFGRSEGLFFLQFQTKFQTTAQLGTWPGSLMNSVHLIMGPVCAAVVNRYSMRTAYMLGGLLAAAGMILNGFAPNVYFLFFSHTLLAGAGRGLLTGILLLNLYFDKHRSLATGIAMAGVGVGSLWVVPLTQYLFDTYGFTGAFLILGGLVSHTFVLAMMFRPLRMHLKFTKADAKHRVKARDRTQADEDVALTLSDKSSQDDGSAYQPKGHNTSSNSVRQISNAHTELNTSTNSPQVTDTGLDKSLLVVTSEHLSKLDDYKTVEGAEGKESLVAEGDLQNKITSVSLVPRKRKQEGCLMSSIKILFPVEYKRKETEKQKKTFDWTLIKNSRFMIFVLANFFFLLAFKTALTFLPAIALSKGLTDTEAALMLTISGALDTFGRVAGGFIMDLRPLHPLRPYIFNLIYFIIAGVSLLVPFLDNFASFSLVCAVYGLTTGASATQSLVVLVDIVGRDVMPSSLGIMRVFQGFGSLIGPPMAGALRDALGSYDSSFYLGGASMFGAALLLALGNLLPRLRKRKPTKGVTHHGEGDNT